MARQRKLDDEERQRKADELALGQAEAAREAASRAEMEAERQVTYSSHSRTCSHRTLIVHLNVHTYH